MDFDLCTPLTCIDLFSRAVCYFRLGIAWNKPDSNNCFLLKWGLIVVRLAVSTFPWWVLPKGLTTLTGWDLIGCLNGQAVDLIIGEDHLVQFFSMAGKVGRTFTDDPRSHLFKEFVRIVKIVQPYFFCYGKCSATLSRWIQGKTRIEIIQAFQNIGYSVECKITGV